METKGRSKRKELFRWAFECACSLAREAQVSVVSNTCNPKFKMHLLLALHLYFKHKTFGIQMVCA